MAKRDYESRVIERARDELFSHIRRCGVLEAETEQRQEWLTDTVEYLGERYPELTETELVELQEIGRRYCMPPISHNDDGRNGEPAASEETTSGEQGEVNAA